MWFTILYISSVIYCLSKLSQSRINSHVNSSHYHGDGLDTLMVILLAPFLAIMDIMVSLIYFFKKSQ